METNEQLLSRFFASHGSESDYHDARRQILERMQQPAYRVDQARSFAREILRLCDELDPPTPGGSDR
jgi:hypothetical protein